MKRRKFLKSFAWAVSPIFIPESLYAWIGTRMRRSSTSVAVVPGSQTITATGAGSFTIPPHNWIDIELWGGGGSGGEDNAGSNGNAGGSTTCNGLSAGGGNGGIKATLSSAGGSGGAATGGDTNTNGNVGGTSLTSPPMVYMGGTGGDCPNGGTGGAGAFGTPGNGTNGNAPGGGGGGCVDSTGYSSGGGGSGAYCKKRYLSGTLSPGSSLGYTVGVGGAPPNDGGAQKGGSGGNGQIKFTWA